MEKQGYLIELKRMKARGIELSREFSEADSLAELEFEVAKQNASVSTENSVSFMRDMLRLVITGLEVGNNKLGPFLSMEGWAEATTADMHRYDNALERIHRRYFRKSQMSPIMEMAWLLFGSLAMWHFKSKFLGGGSSSSSSARSSAAPPKKNSATSSSTPSMGGLLGGLSGLMAGGNNNAPAPAPAREQREQQSSNEQQHGSNEQRRRPILKGPTSLFS